jgi:hypothetical protein
MGTAVMCMLDAETSGRRAQVLAVVLENQMPNIQPLTVAHLSAMAV